MNLEDFYRRSSNIFGSKYHIGGWLTKLDLLTIPIWKIFLYGNSKLSRYGLEKQVSTISPIRKLKVWRTRSSTVRCPFCRSVRKVGSYVFYSCTPELSPARATARWMPWPSSPHHYRPDPSLWQPPWFSSFVRVDLQHGAGSPTSIVSLVESDDHSRRSLATQSDQTLI